MRVCKLVRYHGRVQGVGFRYTAHGLARNHDVAGYVRNLPGGEVELVAEGDADEVQHFLDAVAAQMSGYIEGQTIRDEPSQDFTDFSIRA